jgi:hypothetical protein
LAADGAEMRAVRVPHNLNAVVGRVADDEVTNGVKRQEAIVATRTQKLAIAAAIATNAAQVRAIAESEHLHAITIKHGKAARAVASGCGGRTELAVAEALGAYGAHMGAIAVPQHLHAMITVISHKDVPGAVKGKAHRT